VKGDHRVLASPALENGGVAASRGLQTRGPTRLIVVASSGNTAPGRSSRYMATWWIAVAKRPRTFARVRSFKAIDRLGGGRILLAMPGVSFVVMTFTRR
jgi:hypothetical protein